jgi:hypothetical protein
VLNFNWSIVVCLVIDYRDYQRGLVNIKLSNYKNRKSPGPKTALINHSLDTNHKFNFPDATVLDSERNVRKRRLLEAGHIIDHGPHAVTIKSDSSNIGSQYYEIIERHSINTSPRIPLVHGTCTSTPSNVPSLNLLPNR